MIKHEIIDGFELRVVLFWNYFVYYIYLYWRIYCILLLRLNFSMFQVKIIKLITGTISIIITIIHKGNGSKRTMNSCLSNWWDDHKFWYQTVSNKPIKWSWPLFCNHIKHCTDNIEIICWLLCFNSPLLP